MNDEFDLYQGEGQPLIARAVTLPPFAKLDSLNAPENYVADKSLRYAVNVAVALGQPLLLTGEPGTGKTHLARSVAYEFDLPLLEFHTKTTSTAPDLFYEYDALSHFHDAHLQSSGKATEARELNPEKYITYKALGLAILLTYPPESPAVAGLIPEKYFPQMPTRSVVLIDEIDKAPRDLPNDILHEIEELAFTVKQTGRNFKTSQDNRPIVILTSNSEKNLPDAFMRRCLFHRIRFPEDTKSLAQIIHRRFGADAFTTLPLESALKRFLEIRGANLTKPPATAELLAWLQILEKLQIRFHGAADEETQELLKSSYAVLAKNKDDRERLEKEFPMI